MRKMPVSTSWRKRFLDYLAAHLPLKRARVQKIFSSLQLNYSRARHKYSMQELRKAQPKLCSLEKSGGDGSFGLTCCLDGAFRTRGGGLTGEEGADARGGAMVRVGVGLVMSWVSCCSWAIRPMRVVLMACSKMFCHLVSSWR